MYIPKAFEEKDKSTLFEVMNDYNFATLITWPDNLPIVSHLPFLIETNKGKNGTLIAHLAKTNPHAKLLEQQQSLIIFQGPHSYISPNWYKNKNAVPTWNYAAIHCYGVAHMINNKKHLLSIVEKLANKHEKNIENPWSAKLNPEKNEKLLKAIVGIEIPIDHIEGKFKFNQNMPSEDQEHVISTLSKLPSNHAQNVAKIMKKNLQRKR